jgi:ubiquinone/menaquinone biosynthesis C-methylase UbiE
MATEQVQKQRAIETHSQQAGEFADSYRAFEQDAYQTCFLYSRRRLEAALASHLPERGDGLRILDVGCGTGHHMASLRARGYEVAGVDGSAEMLAHARANNPGAEIYESDVERLPFADKSFDYVICIEVLRYLPDFRRCVKEMVRVLRPGGVCLATAAPLFNSNGYFLVNRLASLASIGDLVPLKQFFATSGRLRRGFLEAGFASVEIQGVYTGPVNWVERLAPSKLSSFLRSWERLDARLADRAVLREFANMFLIDARKR